MCSAPTPSAGKRWREGHKIIPTSAAEHLTPVRYGRRSSHVQLQGFFFFFTGRTNNSADLTHKHNNHIPLPLSTNKLKGLRWTSGGSCVGCGDGGWMTWFMGTDPGVAVTPASCLRRSEAAVQGDLHHV